MGAAPTVAGRGAAAAARAARRGRESPVLAPPGDHGVAAHPCERYEGDAGDDDDDEQHDGSRLLVVRTLGQEPLGACAKQCGEARGELTAHRRGDALGLAWLVLVVGAYLSPSLKDGFSFGPADIGRQLSYLTYVPHLAVHNSVNGDIITQEVPWNTLDWLAVHHGQLPLWNNYSGDGMPLMLNFESKSFALPTLVGYLFPLSVSFLASIAALLLIAGSGAYVAARLIGAGPLGAALAGTTFMLSGSLSGWAGWAVSGPLVWAGWALAGAVLCWKPGRWRSAGVVLVALSTAFAVYGGFPETLALGALGTGSIVVIAGACGAVKGKVRLAGPARLTAGVAAGAALSSPLWLSGLSVLSQSSRAGENGTGGLPVRALSLLFAQGYDGLPTKGSVWFGPVDYYEATAYVGTVAVVLAVLAVLVGWRRPVVAGLVGAALISLVVVYTTTAQHLFTDLGAGSVATQRMLPMLAFALAMLAGLGTEALRRSWRDTTVRVKLAASTGACALVLAYLLIDAGSGGVTAAELSVRRHALIWPALTLAGTAAGLAAATFSLRRTNLAAGRHCEGSGKRRRPGGARHLRRPAGRPVGLPGVGRDRAEQLLVERFPGHQGGRRAATARRQQTACAGRAEQPRRDPVDGCRHLPRGQHRLPDPGTGRPRPGHPSRLFQDLAGRCGHGKLRPGEQHFCPIGHIGGVGTLLRGVVRARHVQTRPQGHQAGGHDRCPDRRDAQALQRPGGRPVQLPLR